MPTGYFRKIRIKIGDRILNLDVLRVLGFQSEHLGLKLMIARDGLVASADPNQGLGCHFLRSQTPDMICKACNIQRDELIKVIDTALCVFDAQLTIVFRAISIS